MSVNTDKLLFFLSSPKTRKQVEEEFNLSNTESQHLMRWIVKGKFARCFYARVEGKVGNKGKYYIKI